MYRWIVGLWGNPRVVDSVLALLTFAAMCVLGALYPTDAYRAFDVWAYVLTGLICLPLAARRIAPMAVLVVVSAAFLVYVLADHLPGLHLWGPLMAFYSVAAQKPPRVTAVGAVVLAVPGVFCALALLTPPAAVLIQVPVVTAVAWGWGTWGGSWRRPPSSCVASSRSTSRGS